jgi:predicted DNA-binding transcriptional regulator AlpA
MIAIGSVPNLSVSGAAEYVGVSVSYLNKLRSTGGGPVYAKIGSRRIVYRLADLDAWLAASRRRSTSEIVVAA